MGFSPEQVASFIAVLGVLSVLAQVKVIFIKLKKCIRIFVNKMSSENIVCEKNQYYLHLNAIFIFRLQY